MCKMGLLYWLPVPPPPRLNRPLYFPPSLKKFLPLLIPGNSLKLSNDTTLHLDTAGRFIYQVPILF